MVGSIYSYKNWAKDNVCDLLLQKNKKWFKKETN
jgi:hypothetical protein